MDVLSSLWALIKEPFFTYSVSASFGNATVEYIDEHLLDDMRETNNGSPVGLLTLVSGFFGGIMISLSIYMYAEAVDSVAMLAVTESLRNQAMIAGALEALWIIPYLHATNRVGALKAAPLFQAIPIFSFIFGYFFFKEVFELTQIIACLVIIAGGLLLNMNKETFKIDTKTLWQMLLASATIAFVYSFFNEIAKESNFMATLFWMGIGMTGMCVVIWIVKKSYRQEFNAFLKSPRKKLVALQLANEGINALSVAASAYAVWRAPNPMVATALNAFHPVFLLIIGWVMGKNGSAKHSAALKSGEGVKTGISIFLIVIGTLLLAL